MTSAVCIFIFLLTFGCLSKGAMVEPIKPSVERIDTSAIGQVQEKAVGEPMIRRGSVVTYPGFMAIDEYKPPISNRMEFDGISGGTILTCSERTEDGLYVCGGEWGSGIYHGDLGIKVPIDSPWELLIGPSGSPYGAIGAVYRTVIKFKIESKQKFEKTVAYTKNSFMDELLYNGRSGQTIKVTFREYRNDMARPAFFQELSYDLSESKEIAFRDIRVEIIEATNSYIKFIVKGSTTAK